MKRILWLTSWYPNKLQPFAGDFIERHARSASLYHTITVLFLIKDPLALSGKKYLIETRRYNDNCSALILYYAPISRIKIIELVLSGLRYCLFFSELVRQYIRDHGKPDLLHVHVCWRAGLAAMYCRWRYKLDYVVSEHWSAFMPGARPSIKEKSFIARFFIKRVFRKALRCSAVSRHLSETLSSSFDIPVPRVIPNVVDSSIFQPSSHIRAKFRFIHVSEFNYQKNPVQIFQALSLLRGLTGQPFEMHVFAPDENAVAVLAKEFNLSGHIMYHGYVPQEVLALEMNHADSLVLYSRFETFGCVVIEALSSGIPVIVSDIPVMREIVDKTVGVVVPLDNPALLANKMLWMIDNASNFDVTSLKAFADRFNVEKVGKLFDAFYRDGDSARL